MSEMATVEGQVADTEPYVYVGLWKEADGYWRVSGTMYRAENEVVPCLSFFKPVKVVVVKVPARFLQ
jgi:hypothetical protein